MDYSSRYANVDVVPALDGRRLVISVQEPWHMEEAQTYAVFHRPIAENVGRYRTHRWVEGDRWDHIAIKYLGASAEWWRIADANPQVYDIFHMLPGEILRIPLPEGSVL